MSEFIRALISGYYGYGNAGDEAILGGLVAGFRQLDPSLELTVLSSNPSATMAEHDIVAVPRHFASVRRNIPLCNLVVSGGGGLLQDTTSWRSPLYYLGIMWLGRKYHRPVVCVGQGIGPLRRPLSRWLTRRVLAQVDAIAVRDELSRQALIGLGLGRKPEVTADLSFLLRPPSEDEMFGVRGEVGLDPDVPAAAIALRPLPGAFEDIRLAERLGAMIGESCHRLNVTPVLIPMQSAVDVEFARSTATAVPERDAVIVPPLPTRKLLALIASCQITIAMRLHALIFAVLGGKPLVAISYDPKVDGLMQQLQLGSGVPLDRIEKGGIADAIMRVWDTRDAMSCHIVEQMDSLRAAALRNIEIALSAIRQRPT